MNKNREIYSLAEGLEKILFEKDYVEVEIGSTRSALSVARKNKEVYGLIKKMAGQDYIYYHQRATRACFVRRIAVCQMWRGVKSGAIKHEAGLYWSENIHGEKVEKIIVVFSSLPPAEKYFSHAMYDRCFNQNNSKIGDFVRRNTLIVRVADLNVVYGSYYMNTTNYVNYEEKISRFLVDLPSRFGLEKKDVVLYGSSKGGLGAFYYSLVHDFRCVACDPVIDMTRYHEDGDLHYLLGLEIGNRYQKLDAQKRGNQPKIVIASENVKRNFDVLKQLWNRDPRFCIINMRHDFIESHPDVTTKTLSTQNMCFNLLLTESKFSLSKVINCRFGGN